MAETWKKWEGQTVDQKFHLRQYLGGSEHSAVFLADSNEHSPSTVAIRLVPEDSPSAARQLSSWRLAATASHPNLTRIFSAGHCQIDGVNLLYAVMEYAEENLSQVVPQRPLTANEASDMLKPALDALAYLHARGLVHGRVKPANILASGDQLKLSSDHLRRAGEPISDPDTYDPPETASSPASDTWSLGMTLVEVLTQRLPAWNRKAQRDPDIPGVLPAPLLDIARHCLRRDPQLRWTAADIANRLNPRVAVGQAQPARRDGSPVRSRYAIPAVILLLALTAFATLKWVSHSFKSGTDLSQAAEKTSATRLTESRQAGSASPAIEKQATLAETQSSSTAFERPAAISPVGEAKASSTGAGESRVIHQVLPAVPQKARDTIWGTVRVGIRVSVDPTGSVTAATIDSPGPSRYFANLALQAARQWSFAPARGSASDWALRFEFSRDGTKAFAKQMIP